MTIDFFPLGEERSSVDINRESITSSTFEFTFTFAGRRGARRGEDEESILRQSARDATSGEEREDRRADACARRASRRSNVHGMPTDWLNRVSSLCCGRSIRERGIERPLSGARSMYGAAHGAEKRGYRCQIFRRRPPRTGSLYTERLRK